MARIIRQPSMHSCHKELEAELSNVPLGTIAECSCSKQYERVERGQFDGRDWKYLMILGARDDKGDDVR